MRLNVIHKSETTIRPGDIYHSYYFPAVLAGRSIAFFNDIHHLLQKWMDVIAGNPHFDAKVDDRDSFILMIDLFKSMKFSYIHAKTELEDASDAWQLLCGVWIDIFLSEYSQAFDPENYNDALLLRCVGCIYCLYLLYYTQYPDSVHALPKRVPMSPSTLQRCIDVCEKCEKEQGFIKLRLMLQTLTRDGGIVLCATEGPQNFYQNRVGNPLPVNKDLLHLKKISLYRSDTRLLKEEADDLNEMLEGLQRDTFESDLTNDSLNALRDDERKLKQDITKISDELQKCDAEIIRPLSIRYATEKGAASVGRDVASTQSASDSLHQDSQHTDAQSSAALLQQLEDELISGLEFEG